MCNIFAKTSEKDLAQKIELDTKKAGLAEMYEAFGPDAFSLARLDIVQCSRTNKHIYYSSKQPMCNFYTAFVAF